MGITHDLKKEAGAVASLLASLRSTLGDDEELKLTAIEGETNLYEVAVKCHERLIELEILRSGIKVVQENLKTRDARFATQEEVLRSALLRALEAAEVERLELPTATLYTSKGKDGAVISDEAAIPSKYWKRPEPVVDKSAVLKDLKDKIEIPGASLKNGAPVLNIRSK